MTSFPSRKMTAKFYRENVLIFTYLFITKFQSKHFEMASEESKNTNVTLSLMEGIIL